jgi:hypothetical protein
MLVCARGAFPGADSSSVSRAALPGKLRLRGSPTWRRCGGRRQALRPVLEERPRRIRVGQDERRNGEHLDVPHDVTAVVVVVRPVGEPEQRRARGRRRVDGRLQIEVRSVEHRLPARWCVDLDAPRQMSCHAAEFSSRKRVKTSLPSSEHQANRLQVGLVVHGLGNDRRNLPKSYRLPERPRNEYRVASGASRSRRPSNPPPRRRIP